MVATHGDALLRPTSQDAQLSRPSRGGHPQVGTLFRCGLALSAGPSEDDRTLGTMEWATCRRRRDGLRQR
eukprot:scaffold34437_cov33-Phaeocystis_antarctica.AAC.1